MAEELASEMERKTSAERGPNVLGWGVIETMCSSPSGGIRGEAELSQPQYHFQLDAPKSKGSWDADPAWPKLLVEDKVTTEGDTAF